MDGVHDLGGKQGFGPVTVAQDDEAFQHEWQTRMWAIARSGARGKDITIDWWRHTLECMVPSDYLSFNYFQKWCTSFFVTMIDSGTFTIDEITSGTTHHRNGSAKSISLDEALVADRLAHRSFEIETSIQPAFAPGDEVLTLRQMRLGHNRLPAYARGARGEVIACHGAHLLPDKVSRGVHKGEHLYTIVFQAPELWGDEADPRDSVALDLWESYLVPTR